MNEKECTKCKEIKPIGEFSLASYTKTGFTCWCKPCKQASDVLYRARNKERLNKAGREAYSNNKAKFSARGKRYREANLVEIAKKKRASYNTVRAFWDAFISDHVVVKCIECGYDKCKAALDFHHVRDKLFTISRACGYAVNDKNKELMITELDKCVILCSNCHREHHHNENNTRVTTRQG